MITLWRCCKTIIVFLVIILIIQVVSGDKSAQKMSVIILFSMLIFQVDSVSKFLSAVSNNLNNTELDPDLRSSVHTSSSGREHGGSGRKF